MIGRATRPPVDAVVTVPGSKSIANRALIVAALAAGRSTLSNMPDGDDTGALLRCLATLGVAAGPVSGSNTEASHPAETVQIEGCDGRLHPTGDVAHAALAGTTSRFVLAAAALADRPVTVDGFPPLRARPFGPLLSALRQLGATVTAHDRDGHLPATVAGPLTAGRAALPGDVSSQYLSALMMIGPYLAEGLHLELTSELVSRPYVELTAAVMADFGVDGVEVGERAISVEPGCYVGGEYRIEPDASTASYPLAVAAVRGGRVLVEGLSERSRQGDRRIVELLTAMGCTAEDVADGTAVTRPPTAPLVGIDADLADCSDLVPTIAAVAAVASTPSTIRGVGFIRAKESDRLGDLAGELCKLGADVRETPDGLQIRPVGGAAALCGAHLATHHDHRLAMAFGVLTTVVDGIVLDDPSVVTKSWPDYWTRLAEIAGGAG